VPPPRPAARWSSLGWILAALALAAAAAMVPWRGECGFRVVLGADCPGCGMTRAVAALLRGDVAGSFRLHPLGIPAALAAAAAVGLALHEGATRRPTLHRFLDRWGVRAAVAGVVLLAGVWLVRVVVHPAWAADPVRPGSAAARWLER
jgi:hypothetical protein